MDQKEFEKILDRYLQGKANPEEKIFIDKWFHAIDEVPLNLPQSEQHRIKAKILQALQDQNVDSKPYSQPKTHISFFRLASLARIAAVILLVVLGTVYLFKDRDPKLSNGIAQHEMDYNTVSNDQAEDKTILLSDGSRLVIKTGSAIRYPVSFEHTKREVYLEKGEVFFEVARDESRPFLVLSNNITTRVLGTSFTVKSSLSGDVTVAVLSGKVSVSAASLDHSTNLNQEIFITVNQKAFYDSKHDLLVASLVEKPQIVSREQFQDISFEAAALTDIFKMLSKTYRVQIDFEQSDFSNCVLTTSIEAGDNLFDRLNVICKAIGATYTIENTTIRIQRKGKGC